MGDRGLVLVYTGDGKGKTTAAFGLALRSWGRGRRVCIVQFMKCGEKYGEVRAVRGLAGIELHQFGRKGYVTKGKHKPEDVEMAKEALLFSGKALSSGEFDLVILDEACVAVDFGLIGLPELLSAIDARSPGTDVVVTGRNAPEALIAVADLVTEMRSVKHPYDTGKKARIGIEY